MISKILFSVLLLFSAKVALADGVSIGTACDANFASKKSFDHDHPMSYVTWASVTQADPHSTIAQFKTIAGENGYDLAAESYHGSQGYLLLNRQREGKKMRRLMRLGVI